MVNMKRRKKEEKKKKKNSRKSFTQRYIMARTSEVEVYEYTTDTDNERVVHYNCLFNFEHSTCRPIPLFRLLSC